MLAVHQISKAYGPQPILAEVSFSVNPGERVGLIGPNGCGKTTLLRMITAEEQPDAGHVHLTPADLRLGYLPQGFEPDPQESVGQLLGRAGGNPAILEAELVQLAEALAHNPQNQALQNRYDLLLAQLEQPAAPGRRETILAALELADLPAEQLVCTLSGGQKTRLSLALVLLADPQLLLLDEPTNHLDIEMLEWLEDWLAGFPGAALIVSHDRLFLEHTVTRILDLNPESHRIQSYDGAYSDYIEQFTRQREHLWATYRDQVAEIRRVKQDIARTKEHARQVEITTTSRQPGVRAIAKKVARKAKSREKKLQRYLDSDERIEKPKAGWQLKLDFEQPEHLSQQVLVMDNLAVGYAGSPPLLSDVTLTVQAGARIAFSGPNGSGKTTLLRTIAGRLEPCGGYLRLGTSVRLGYLAQEQEVLDPDLSPVETLQAVARLNQTETRNFLHHFLFSGDDALRSVGLLSYGERTRLMLARLIAQGCNFLLLDEPINHLDIPSRERFEQALSGFSGTVLAVVHDRFFIRRFASEIWWLQAGQIHREVKT